MLDLNRSDGDRSQHVSFRELVVRLLNGVGAKKVVPTETSDAMLSPRTEPQVSVSTAHNESTQLAQIKDRLAPTDESDVRQEPNLDLLLDALCEADKPDAWDLAVMHLVEFAARGSPPIEEDRLVRALDGAAPALVVDAVSKLLPLVNEKSGLLLAMAHASLTLGDVESVERSLVRVDHHAHAADVGRIMADLHFFNADEPAGIAALALAEQDGLRNAFEVASERADVALRAALRTEGAEDWHRAGEALAAVARCWPDRASTTLEAARCYRRAGFPKKALSVYRTIIDPAMTTDVALAVADTLIEMKRWDDAISHLREAAGDSNAILKRRLYDLLREGGRAGGPLPRSRGGAMPSIDGGVAERALLNRLTSRVPLRDLIGSLDRDTHVPASEWGFGDAQSARFDQVGWLEMLHEGRREPLLVGVVSVRGRILSDRTLTTVDLIFCNEVVVADEPLALVRHTGGRILYAFNIWLDANRIGPARGELCVWARNDIGSVLTATAVVNVTQASESLNPAASDSFVASTDDWTNLEADVLARPPLIRSSLRPLFVGEVREVLAMRVDQLGDLSATLPAIRRLRELFPDARLTALVSAGLRDIVAATGLCDEILGLTLVYDHVSERRYLPADEQARLLSAFDQQDFDIAIDFCPADETRAILKLVNAKYLVGFNPREFKYLDLGVDIFTRDKFNQASIISHSAYVSVLVEALAVAIRPTQGVVERRCDDTVALARLGLRPGGYIVLHSGARHAINCWPFDHFVELAERIARDLDYQVVFFADRRDAVWHGNARVTMAGNMPIDLFDAVIANAMLMVGNDSGPKHLAAVHGVRTVSVHINRLNWREWGQDGEGVIISKKVPCCGCGLNNLAMCAKNAVCITSITVDNVFGAVVDQLSAGIEELPIAMTG